MDEATKSAEGLGEALSGFAEDGDLETDEADDEISEDGLQDEVIDDLRDLVAAAILEGNIKLAYRIERTIDEILEQDTPCT
jgi:hypothetical protein